MKNLILFFFVFLNLTFASINSILIESANTLDRFMAIPEEQIPPKLLKKANAIAIIPNLIRGGFFVGARYGKGVMLFKKNGRWSNPLFIKMIGGSLGWQIGLESIDVILVFVKRGVLNDLINGKITLGIDASVAVGPIGRHAMAGTDIKFTSEVYSYSRSQGAYIGVALAGSSITLDDEYNQRFYKSGYIKLDAIFNQRFNNPYLKILKQKLQEYSRW